MVLMLSIMPKNLNQNLNKEAKMRNFYFISLIYFILNFNLFCLELTDEQAVLIAIQNTPLKLIESCQIRDSEEYLDYDGFLYFLKEDRRYGWKPDGKMRALTATDFKYFTFNMPNDPNDYLFLAWSICVDGAWKILKTNDGGKTFETVCENKGYLGDMGFGWGFRLIDLTGDNIPELLYEGTLIGASNSNGQSDGITPWQWKDGCFRRLIDPSYKIFEGDYGEDDGWGTNSYITIDDLNNDGKAEIIIGPYLERIDNGYTDEEGNWIPNVTWEPTNNGEVWHFNGEYYVKWYEFSPMEKHPFYVPSLAVFHPSTIPLSELKNPGQGKIKIFVSDPAGSLTSNDFQTDSFKYLETPIEFKKIWKNKKYPSEDEANFEFLGVPVYQSVRKSKGDWQINPSDPFVLSPDLNMEYHFVGDYIEIEMPRSLVFKHLLKNAEEQFKKLSGKDTVIISLPFEGKFKNGKKGVFSAIIGVKKTGNEKK